MGRKSGLAWTRRRHGRWTLRVFHCLLAMESRLKIFAESISYQPCRARYERVSSVQSRPVDRSLCFSICRMKFTLLLDWYASFKLPIYSHSEISALKLLRQCICCIDSDSCHTECIIRYPWWVTRCGKIKELEGTSAKCILVTGRLWECLRVVGPECQGGQIPEFTGAMQWPSGAPGSTWEGQPQAWECRPQVSEHVETL